MNDDNPPTVVLEPESIHAHTETHVSEEVTGLVLSTPRRKTGVIFAVPLNTTANDAIEIRKQLQERFPEVVVAVAPGSSSVSFEWDEPEPEGDVLW